MIAVARTSLAGSARRAGRGLITGPAGPDDPAGQLLGRLSVLPVLLLMAWLLPGLPLLLLGVFTPVLMLLLAAPLAVLIVAAGLRWIPGLRPQPAGSAAESPDRSAEPARTPCRRGKGVAHGLGGGGNGVPISMGTFASNAGCAFA